jgi:putative phosphotransacetylase
VEIITAQPTVKVNGTAINIEQVAHEVLRRLTEKAERDEPSPQVRTRNGVKEMPVSLGVSARHVHLCPEHIEILFGEGHDLQVYAELSQKGYYAAREQVMVVGRKRCLEKVRVLGPPRAISQVELAQTDAIALGLKLPVATDGSEPGTQPITLVGPEGAVSLPGDTGGGAFIARRHLHISEVEAETLGIKAGDLLDLRLDGPRSATLHGILVRVKAGWRTEVHLDTDEANACSIRNGQIGTLIIP